MVEEEETYSQGDDGSSTANHRQRLDPGSDDRRQEDLWRRGEEWGSVHMRWESSPVARKPAAMAARWRAGAWRRMGSGREEALRGGRGVL